MRPSAPTLRGDAPMVGAYRNQASPRPRCSLPLETPMDRFDPIAPRRGPHGQVVVYPRFAPGPGRAAPPFTDPGHGAGAAPPSAPAMPPRAAAGDDEAMSQPQDAAVKKTQDAEAAAVAAADDAPGPQHGGVIPTPTGDAPRSLPPTHHEDTTMANEKPYEKKTDTTPSKDKDRSNAGAQTVTAPQGGVKGAPGKDSQHDQKPPMKGEHGQGKDRPSA